jgi:Spy/CpxP family protein refolding chaperone
MVDPIAPKPARGLLSVLAIFALGIIFGVALSFVIVHHVVRPAFLRAHRDGPMPIERITRRLDLDAAQQDKIRAILERGHAKVRDALDETRKDVRAELRSDQQEKFDRMHPRGAMR